MNSLSLAQLNSLSAQLSTPAGVADLSKNPLQVLERNGLAVPKEHQEIVVNALAAGVGKGATTTSGKCFACHVGYTTLLAATVAAAVTAIGAAIIASGGADAAAAPAEVIAAAEADIAICAAVSGIEFALMKAWFTSAWTTSKNPLTIMSFLATKICEKKGSC